MKLVRYCLIVSTVCALSACSSSSSVHTPFFKKKRGQPAAAAPAPVVATPAAPTAETPPPAATPAPVTEPVAAATPVMEAAPVTTAPAAVVAAVTPTPAPVTPPAPTVVTEPGIKAVRTGRLVQLSWTLPVNEAGYRIVEVMRNASELPKGRTRVKALRPTVTQLDDMVEGTGERYWYWLKLTDQNNTVTNLGPFEAVETTR